MKDNYTHIAIVLDRSGSMQSIKGDIIGGFNHFLSEQRNLEQEATLSLIQFDTVDPYEVVYDFCLVKEVAPLGQESFQPRGGTPLFDCLGKSLTRLKSRLDEMKFEEKPSQVIFVVVTDGEENSSRNFTQKQVQKLIGERRELDGWKFVFLSADEAALEEARETGMSHGSSMLFDKDHKSCMTAWSVMSHQVKECREDALDEIYFSAEERLSAAPSSAKKDK